MTPTQQAMCAVIRESGLDGVRRCAKRVDVDFLVNTSEPDGKGGWVDVCSGEWMVTVDGHELTQQEYEQWAKQQD